MCGKCFRDGILIAIGMVGDEITCEYLGSRNIPLGLGRAKDVDREILHGAARTAARIEFGE